MGMIVRVGSYATERAVGDSMDIAFLSWHHAMYHGSNNLARSLIGHGRSSSMGKKRKEWGVRVRNTCHALIVGQGTPEPSEVIG